MTPNASWDKVLKLLHEEQFGVLGTTRAGHAYTSLVAFATSADDRDLYFASTRATRKYHNLATDARVAFLIDNRGRQSLPLYEAAAVTAYGQANELTAEERPSAMQHYLARHPQLKSFVTAPTTALFCIRVDSYHLVERFQHVTEFRIDR
ncbi:MAG: pyridoxamine 5'-phosphate oxidase family protein [Desulfuromonadales bacterium]